MALILSPDSPVLRGPRELRERVDAKLGSGTGITMAEARDRLSPAERVEWVLGECLVTMLDRRFHLWVQGWCLDLAMDGPAAIAAVAEAARPLNPLVADLLRWTSLRGVWARTGERKEALINVVPEVWLGAWDGVPAFMAALASRWPEDADPFALPAPAPWSRAQRPSSGSPRYPGVRPSWGKEPRPDTVLETACHALWAGGATEDDLDAFFFEMRGELVPVLARWVGSDPAELEALNVALHPPDPLAIALGIEKMSFPMLAVRPADREAEFLAAAAAYHHVVLDVTPERSFAQAARSALRMDPDLVVARANDVGENDAPMLLTTLETGHAVLILGESPSIADLKERAAAMGIRLL
ncbi:MAG TPA: hypothetical protein VNM14_19065 [Planctomycetota bacterium]|jgi:hypothetical protein|nr:hypothetical protein [Planctomycetota bacterium]